MKRVLLSLLLLPGVAVAQQQDKPIVTPIAIPELTPKEVPPPTESLEKREYRLYNTMAAIIAWKLDARHNPEPPFLRISERTIGLKAAETDDKEIKEKVPSGIVLIESKASTNSLIAYGPRKALDELAPLIHSLDIPVRQLEIEAQFVELSNTDLKKLGLVFQPAEAPPGPASDVKTLIADVKSSKMGTLLLWHKTNKVKVITAPRVISLENYTASIYTMTSTPANLEVPAKTFNKNAVTLKPGDFSERYPAIGSSLGITAQVRRISLAENTISLDFYGGCVLSLSTMPSSQQQKHKTPSLFNTPEENEVPSPQFLGPKDMVAARLNMLDGQTVAISGLPAQFGLFYRPKADANTKDRQTVIFLTARIIRRLSDDRGVPGT